MMLLLRIIVGVLLLGWAGVAWGNGVYIPETAVPVLPAIPQQRAIIQYRNGIETLVVESTFDTKSPNVAWILPCPAVPTKIEQVDPGVLTTMQICMGPRITHDLSEEENLALFPFLAALPIAAIAIWKRQKRGQSIKLLILAYVGLTCLWSIMLPSLGRAGISYIPSSPIMQQSMQHIGNYEVAVLQPRDAHEFNVWLLEHGLASLPPAAVPIIQQYIAEHWCFLAAKLGHEGSGPAAPHPLAITFPAAAPVFPMRLTALANTTTHVELFFIANEQAGESRFHCALADRFTMNGYEPEPYFVADSVGVSVAHPDIVPLLYDGCIITRAKADLSPARMDRDVEATLAPLEAQRDHVYSTKGRSSILRITLYCGLTLLAILAAIIFRGRRRPGEGQLQFFKVCVLIAVGLPIAVFCLLPTMEMRTSSGKDAFRSRFRNHYIELAIEVLVMKGELRFDSPVNVIKNLPKLINDPSLLNPAVVENPYTGGPMIYERSPGNFSSRIIKGVNNICLYEEDGREMHIPLDGTDNQ